MSGTGSKAPFNWLTQSSLDTFADYSLSASETPSSLLFNVGSGGQRSSSRRTVGAAQMRGSGPRDGFGGRIPRPTAGAAGSANEEGVCECVVFFEFISVSVFSCLKSVAL